MIDFDKIIGEFNFETARSGGKGGQNVNKVESKVSLVWRFEDSAFLTLYEKRKIKENAKSYLFSEGIRITSQKSRSQFINKQQCIQKLKLLLTEWLKRKKIRRPTKTPRSVIAKRLKNKKINATIKKNRNKPRMDD